jgi:hypothetical protein
MNEHYRHLKMRFLIIYLIVIAIIAVALGSFKSYEKISFPDKTGCILFLQPFEDS